MSRYYIGIVESYENLSGTIVFRDFDSKDIRRAKFTSTNIFPNDYNPKTLDVVFFSSETTRRYEEIKPGVVYRLDSVQTSELVYLWEAAILYSGRIPLTIGDTGTAVFEKVINNVPESALIVFFEILSQKETIDNTLLEPLIKRCTLLKKDNQAFFIEFLYNIIDDVIKKPDIKSIASILTHCDNLPKKYYLDIVDSLNMQLVEHPQESPTSAKELSEHIDTIIQVAKNNKKDLYGELYMVLAANLNKYYDIEGAKFLESHFLDSFLETLPNEKICELIKHYGATLNDFVFSALIKHLPNIFEQNYPNSDKSIFENCILDIVNSDSRKLQFISPLMQESWIPAAKCYPQFSDYIKSAYLEILKGEKLDSAFFDNYEYFKTLSQDSYYRNSPRKHLTEYNLLDTKYSIHDIVTLLKDRIIDIESHDFILSLVKDALPSEAISSEDLLKSIQTKSTLDNTDEIKELLTLSLGTKAYQFILTNLLDSPMCCEIAHQLVKEAAEKSVDDILQGTVVFDIEGKEDNGYVVAWDIAYTPLNAAPIVSLIKPGATAKPSDWKKLAKYLSNAKMVSGHRIREWDLCLIKKSNYQLQVENKIWDTLELELLVSPLRKSYALNIDGGHVASTDVRETRSLLKQQIIKLLYSPSLFSEIQDFIPSFAREKIDSFHKKFLKSPKKILTSDYDQKTHNCFFYPESTDRPLFTNTKKSIGRNYTLVIAPEELWPQVGAQFKAVYFHYPSTEPVSLCNPLDHERIRKELKYSKNLLEKHLYLFVESRKESGAIMYSELSEYVRRQPESQKFHKYILDTSEASSIHCASLGQACELLQKFDYGSICIAGSIYQSTKTRLNGDEHISEVQNIINSKKYSPFTRVFYPQNQNADARTFHYFVQDRPGEFSVINELNTKALIKECNSRNIKHFVSTATVVDGIKRIETGTSGLKITNERDLAKYWSIQLKAFESIDSPYPKVLLVDNNDEAATISQYYNLRWSDDDGSAKALDRLREGKQKYAVLSLDRIKNTESKFIDSWFSFVLCSRQLSYFLNGAAVKEKEKAEYLLRYYRHLIETNAYCDSFYLLEESGKTRAFSQNVDAQSEKLQSLLSDKLKIQHFAAMIEWIENKLLPPNGTLKKAQKDSLELLYEGGSKKTSSLTVLPTGYGKSVLFQGPALYKALMQKSNALNIVISPLQALMADQVESLIGIKGLLDNAETILRNEDESLIKLINQDDNEHSLEIEEKIKSLSPEIGELFRLMIDYHKSGSIKTLKKIIKNLEQNHASSIDGFERNKNRFFEFYDRVAYINASTTSAELKRIRQNLRSYRLTLLYIAPERLMVNSFYKKFIEDIANNQGIDSIIFDEAHCITGWGMDFRPSYIHALNKILKLQKCHPSISIQLFTATMTHQAKLDLAKSLKIQDSAIFPVGLYDCKNERNDTTQLALCPIRDFISLHSYNVDQDFEDDEIFDKKIKIVSNYILGLCNIAPSNSESNLLSLLKENTSRVIIFTYSRDDAKEGADKLRELLNNSEASELSGHIDFYHAGLSKERKEYVASRFKSDNEDNIKILFSTKAFGMGIDIPNIHSVIHLTPPTYIEDYLQEVGRSGRDTQARERAGFDENNPIQAICLYSDIDLKKNKDRVDCIRWEDIDDTYKKIYSYISDFKKEKTDQKRNTHKNFYAVPTKLLECVERNANNLSESSDLEELFHKCLIWLSDSCKLNLVEVGFNCPNMYDIEVKRKDRQGLNPHSDLYKFLGEEKISIGRNIIEANELLGDGRYSFHTVADIEKMIDEGVRLGLLSKDYMYVSISLNKRSLLEKDMASYLAKDDGNKDSQQKRNIESIDDGGPILPIKAIFNLIKYNREEYDSFDSLYSQFLEKFENKKIKINESSFNLFNEIKRIYPINDFIIRCYRLIKCLLEKKVNALTWKEIQLSIETGFIQESNEPNTYISDINLYKLVLIALDSLGVINFGNTITDFIEIKLKRPEIKSIGDINNWKEKKKSVDSFYSTQENKAGAMCRLIQLMDDSNAQSSNNIEDAKKLLIDAYKELNLESKEDEVNTLSSQEIIKEHLRLYSLLTDDRLESSVLLKEEHFQAASTQLLESVGANQRDSKKQYKLDEDQVGIFNLKSDTNLNVLAGAGSGKTRLLSYWALKLILCERKSFRSILVLAYNRAVRDEVKNKIIERAQKVGYTIKPDELHVHTFHEFALINVDGIKDKPMAKWEEYLLIDVIKYPQKYHYGNQFDHIIVDEFQDITSTRLATLNLLASAGEGGERSSKVFFVGDKNQSIYGYQKKKDVRSLLSNPEIVSLIRKGKITLESLLVGNDIEDDIKDIQNRINGGNNRLYKDTIDPLLKKISIEPSDYYSRIGKLEDQLPILTKNYRSFQDIINKSEEWLDGRVQMVSQRKPWNNKFESVVSIPDKEDIVEYISSDDFLGRVKQLCQLLKRDYSKEPLTVGVLFRTGTELFDFYNNILKTWYPEHKDEYQINIQGSDISYDKTREFYFFCENLQSKEVKSITFDLIEDVIKDMAACQNAVYDKDILEVIERFSANIIDKLDDKEMTTGKFIQTIKESISYDPIPFAAPGDTKFKKRMVLSVIHRVKGMEYDVVIVPSSNMPIDREYDNLSEQESVQEEKRIMYVAYSRAKSLLIFQHGDREKNLLEYPETQKLYFTGEDGSDYAEDGLSKINLGYLANKNDYKNKTCEYIQKNVKIGQKLTIVVKHVTNNKGESYKRYILKHDGYEIGCLSNDSRISKFLDKNICENSERTEYSGLKVKSVNIQTREQELRCHTILEIEQELEKIKTDEEKNTYLKDNKIYHYYYWKNHKSETFVYYVDYYGKLEESIVKR